jgi:hypothetical protein
VNPLLGSTSVDQLLAIIHFHGNIWRVTHLATPLLVRGGPSGEDAASGR